MGKQKRELNSDTATRSPRTPFFAGRPSVNAPPNSVLRQKSGTAAGTAPATSDISIALKAQKKLLDDIHAFFPDEGRKLAGSGYRATGSPLTADFTEGKVGDVTHSAPVIYVGKAYVDETDADKRKAWIVAEMKKIDQWRVNTGRIDDQDITNSDVNGHIDKEPVPGKMKILKEMAKRSGIANTKIIEHIRKKMPSTPWITGATATAAGGFEFQFENVKIVVQPDVFNSSQVASGAESKIEAVGTTNFNSPSYGWGSDQKINRISFTPTVPPVEYHITTHYSASSDPSYTSGYGVGTRASDTGDQTKLRFHEGMHGRTFIEHIMNNIASNKFPTWTGAIGQTKTDFEAMKSSYDAAVKAFSDMLKAALDESVQQVDCVGKTIVQYHQQQGTSTTVTCRP
ncbi:MAG TPA: hypothetical protein VI603_03510 [Saprospiraceae bacterium]|nr:hypothetical protein [Saprospiraceae bacterium]